MASSSRTNQNDSQRQTHTPQPSSLSTQKAVYPNQLYQTAPSIPPSRPLSHEESSYFDSLLATLDSPDALSIRAIQFNESIPQSRLHIRQEISEFLRNTTTLQAPDKPVYPPRTLFATTPANLIEVCQSRMDSVRGRGRQKRISFATFLRWQKEADARREKENRDRSREVDGGGGGVAATLSPLGEDGETVEDEVVMTASKDKGKRRARRKIWDEDDEKRDILDALD